MSSSSSSSTEPGSEPTPNPNKPGEPEPNLLERYYGSLETRWGNRLFFGGRAHLGYYATIPDGTSTSCWWWTRVRNSWPFPIQRALLAMEDHLFDSVQVDRGAKVLAAGCGDARVAMYLARKGGLRIQAIDVLAQQVEQARRNVEAAKININIQEEKRNETEAESGVTVQQGDYHDLHMFEESSFDGVYTIETLVHARDLSTVLREFYRVLKPGGSLALYEYDHWSGTAARGEGDLEGSLLVDADDDDDDAAAQDRANMEKIHLYGAISRDAAAEGGEVSGKDEKGEDSQAAGLVGVLTKVGFEEVQETDISRNVRPLLRFLYICLLIPFWIITSLGLQAYYINTVALVMNYRHPWRYVAVTARKPKL